MARRVYVATPSLQRDCDRQQRPATAHNTRTIRRDLGYVRPEKQTVGISAVPPRQLPAESSVAEIGRLLRITPGAPAE